MKRFQTYICNFKNSTNPTFIYDFWEVVFKSLQKITLFDLLRATFPIMKRSKYKFVFVELWVVFNVLLAFTSLLYLHNENSDELQILNIFMVIYGILRVFEISITQVNILMFSNNSGGEVRSYKRTIILLFHNYVEIVFWFTLSYLYFSNQFNEMNTESFVEIIYISFITMASFQSSLKPNSGLGYYLISFQTITGLILTLISLARFIPLLTNPKSLDEESKMNDEESKMNDEESKMVIAVYERLYEQLRNQVEEQEKYIRELEERGKSNLYGVIKELEPSKQTTASTSEVEHLK